MTYRDESDALRARVDQLEEQLGQASGKIARLEGSAPHSEASTALSESRLLGAPSAVVLEHTLPFEIDDDGYEAIASVVRTRLKLQVSQVGHALTTLNDRFSLRRENGTTHVVLRGDWAPLKYSIFALPILAGFLGGLPAAGVLADFANHGAPTALLHLLWVLPTLLGSSAYLGRRRIKRTAEEHLRTHRGVFEAVLALAEKHAVRAPAARVRVSDGASKAAGRDAPSSEMAEATQRADDESDQSARKRFT